MINNNTLKEKRKNRKKQTAEDFTPKSLIIEMLKKISTEIWKNHKSTFCDPAAGNGNFLYLILKIKIQKLKHDPIQALSTIYGVELMEDNVEEMKERLLSLIPPTCIVEAKKTLEKNIICYDALKWDFENWKPL